MVSPSAHVEFPVLDRFLFCAGRLNGEAEYLDAAISDADKVQALMEFLAWCASEGNKAGYTAGRLSAVLRLHHVNLQIGVAASSPRIQRAVTGVAWSQVAGSN